MLFPLRLRPILRFYSLKLFVFYSWNMKVLENVRILFLIIEVIEATGMFSHHHIESEDS